jgi:Putative porin
MTAVTVASALYGANVHAQSSDALLNKLVDKGILTTKEAEDLRQETSKDFTKAYAIKNGMPDWVTALKINGDFRARYDYQHSENDAFVERSRFRYRLRLGVVVTIKDNFEVGARLTSSDPTTSFGGDPISGNTTFQDNGAKKFVYFDLAYGKWSFVNTKAMTESITVGKMENPFTFSETVFDYDYTPEGAGYNLTWRADDVHTLKLNAGIFALDELGGDSKDPYLYGAQARWDAAWSKKVATSLGIAALNIVNEQSLTNNAVPNQNRGNTRVGGTGVLANNFNPIVADASFTYTFENGIAAVYSAPFPIKLAGEYVNNVAISDRNEAYQLGVTFGKAGKKGLWEVSYRYKVVESDAWYEEFGESDLGAFYQTQMPNAGFTGTGAGYGAGTNLRGHAAKISYSPFNALTLSVAYYRADVISEVPAGSNSDMSRVIVDAMWKF